MTTFQILLVLISLLISVGFLSNVIHNFRLDVDLDLDLDYILISIAKSGQTMQFDVLKCQVHVHLSAFLA